MRRLPLAAVLLALSQALWAGADPSQARSKLFTRLDPAYAGEYLKDDAAQAIVRLTQGEAAAAEALEQAARLSDLREVLTAHSDPNTLNAALRLRLTDYDDATAAKGLGFGVKPRRLVDWANRHVPGKEALIEKAIYEWKTLGLSPWSFLADLPPKYDAAAWADVPFIQRLGLLRLWADSRHKLALRAVPRDVPALNELKAERDRIWPMLDAAERRELNAHIAKCEVVVDAFRRVVWTNPKEAAALKDPVVAALLWSARSAGSVEATLAALERVFDRAGIKSEAVAAAVPLPAGEGLGSLDPKTLTAALATALRAEARAAPAGVSIDEFYKTQPLELEFAADSPSGAMAWYFHGTDRVVFNLRFIDDFLKLRGVAAKDLLKKPQAMQDLARVLAPSFIHEAQHHVQDVWARKYGLEHWGGQHDEIEAKKLQALWVLQRRKDKAYRDWAAKTINESSLLRSDLALAMALDRSPRSFDGMIRSWYYEGLTSLELAAADRLDQAAAMLDMAREEKRRRDRLSVYERFALDASGKTPAPGFMSVEQWKIQLKTITGASLDELIASYAKRRDDAARTYRLASKRAAAINDAFDRDVADVQGQPKSVDAVPFPGFVKMRAP